MIQAVGGWEEIGEISLALCGDQLIGARRLSHDRHAKKSLVLANGNQANYVACFCLHLFVPAKKTPPEGHDSENLGAQSVDNWDLCTS